MKGAYVRSAVCSLLSLVLLANALRCVTAASTAPAATTEATASNDLAVAIAVALDAADPEQKAVLVAGPGLSAAARAAAGSTGRSILDSDAVPQTAEATFPAGYLRIDSATLSGDEARVRLWKGPIPKAKPGVLLMDCGTGLNFQLKRGSGGIWTISSRGITLC
jgi:hypothetical protein